MATLAEAQAHRAVVEDVVAIAVAELIAEWPDLPIEDVLALRGPLAELLTELVHDFGPMAASLGADWYDDLRAAADVPGSFEATLPSLLPDDRIESSAQWAAAAAWTDADKALRDASAVLDRALADQDRSAVEHNIGRDPAAPRYARYASANACAFCALNATRGAVFRSEDTAATKYHDHCRCVAVPVWSPSDYEEAPYVAGWRDAYYDATKAAGRGADASTILAHMREGAGLR